MAKKAVPAKGKGKVKKKVRPLVVVINSPAENDSTDPYPINQDFVVTGSYSSPDTTITSITMMLLPKGMPVGPNSSKVGGGSWVATWTANTLKAGNYRCEADGDQGGSDVRSYWLG